MNQDDTQDKDFDPDIVEALEVIDERLEDLEDQVSEIDIDTPLQIIQKQIDEYEEKMASFAKEPGPEGKQGRDGERGPRGLVGPQGAKGERGPAGKDGGDGKDGKDGETRVLHGEGGGNLPGRKWQVNGSVIGASFNDVNIVSPGATAANDTTGKRTTLTIPGGGSPGSPDTSVQFNDGGSFGGDEELTWDVDTNTLSVGAVSGGVVNTTRVRADGVAQKPYVSFGDSLEFAFEEVPGASDNGKSINLFANEGGATSGSGGSISLTAGSAQGGDSDGGSITQSLGEGTGSGLDGQFRVTHPSGKELALDRDGYVGINSGSKTAILNADNISGGGATRTYFFPNEEGTLALGPLTSGTYTPTVSAAANTDSTPTVTEAQYMRVGATVTVSGRFTADPTAPATPTSFEIDLPVASNIGAAEDAAGTAFCGTIAGMGAAVIGVAANDTARIVWVSSDVTSQTWSYIFSYQIL